MGRVKRAIRWLMWWPRTESAMDKMLLAFLWCIIGLTIALDGDPDPFHQMPLEFIPVRVRVAIWWASAFLVMINLRVPPGKDGWGWAILAFPTALRAMNYTVGTLMGWVTNNQVGDMDAWRQTLAWIIITLFVLRQAARVEMPRPKEVLRL